MVHTIAHSALECPECHHAGMQFGGTLDACSLLCLVGGHGNRLGTWSRNDNITLHHISMTLYVMMHDENNLPVNRKGKRHATSIAEK
jgi:hypothetical protein